MRLLLIGAAISLGLAVGPSTARAQDIRGTVSDSVTHVPISGAVLILSDDAGATVARTISDAGGRYAFGARGRATHLRGLHIGFRPRDVALPAATGTTALLDVALARLGDMLDTVHVVASNRCVANGNAAQAAALLEQAREGVLATDVAAESKPADMVRLTYVRKFDQDDNPVSQSVHRVANRTVDSFRAVYTGLQFVQMGFEHDSAGYLTFFAPDARTVVDPGFVTGYCFHVTHDRHRPLQVGLAFSPSAHAKDRIDIEGTLWADTARRELRDIEFKYVGLDSKMNRASPGGQIDFRALPNGVVLVDDWSLRLPILQRDTVKHPFVHLELRYRPQETGGRVVSATWPDYTWSAPMGTLVAALRDSSGAPLAGALARLDNTDYAGRADSAGTLRLSSLLPGPYSLRAMDSAFADLPVDSGPPALFDVVADSVTHLKVTVAAPLAGVVNALCPKGLSGTTSSVVVGRLYGDDSTSVVSGGVVTAVFTDRGSIAIATASRGADSGLAHEPGSLPDTLAAQATTNDDGVFALCGLPAGGSVSISAESGPDKTPTSSTPTPKSRRLIHLNLYLAKP